MTETDIAEELFPPRPGGMVDTARKRAQAESDQLDAYNSDAGAPVAGTDYTAIRVRPEAADTGTIRTITLTAAYPVARLLPADPGRRDAVICAIDADVFVSGSQDLLNAAAGTQASTQVGYFPAGVPLPIGNQGEWWVGATTTATNTRITVITNRDSSQ